MAKVPVDLTWLWVNVSPNLASSIPLFFFLHKAKRSPFHLFLYFFSQSRPSSECFFLTFFVAAAQIFRASSGVSCIIKALFKNKKECSYKLYWDCAVDASGPVKMEVCGKCRSWCILWDTDSICPQSLERANTYLYAYPPLIFSFSKKWDFQRGFHWIAGIPRYMLNSHSRPGVLSSAEGFGMRDWWQDFRAWTGWL